MFHFAPGIDRSKKGREPMNPTDDRAKTRRKFLKMLSASPLIAGSSVFAGSLASLLHAAPLEEKHFLGWFEKLQESDSVISTPDQALNVRSEEHTSELQSHLNLVCRLLLEKK